MNTFDGRSPIYRWVADKVSTEILPGELRPDDQVTSTNQYAAHYRLPGLTHRDA